LNVGTSRTYLRSAIKRAVLRFFSPGEAGLRSMLDAQAREPLTYPEVGGTRASDLPPGYIHDRYRVPLGVEVFETAKRGLREWRAHVGAGVSIFPPIAPIEPDANIVLGIRMGPLYSIAACRIVYVCDEADRFGFAYGTLPEHPETGEEAFVVERDGVGQVHFTITAFSRPASPITRLAKPLTRAIQRRVTRGYLEALRRYVIQPD
jgi:uncharacterized protein (UPF0548 family)